MDYSYDESLKSTGAQQYTLEDPLVTPHSITLVQYVLN